jgi:DNA polymerase I-like protein with 3'-5' exonuclease and polymerase domains
VHDCDGEITEELFWFDHKDEAPDVYAIEQIQAYFDDADILIAHNAKYDVKILTFMGVDFNDTPLHCTQVADYIIEGQDKRMKWGLNAVAERYGLGTKHDEVKEMWDSGIDTYDIPSNILGPYCLQDCRLTLDIYNKQLPRIVNRGLEKLIALQNEFTYSLMEMEINGFEFDQDVAAALVAEFAAEQKFHTKRLIEIAGFEFNPGSHQSLSAALYGGILKIPGHEWVIKTYTSVPYSDYICRKTTKEVKVNGVGFKPPKGSKPGADGYYKTDKDTIEKLPARTKVLREFKKVLVAYRKAAKVVSTIQGKKGNTGLLSKIQSDGRIHVKLNQTIAATGRLTSSDPNGQNLPRGNTSPIKKCIIPSYDGIMQVDLSQVEWRGAAYLAQDKVMIREVNAGVDQHIAAVREIMKMKFTDKKDPESKKNRDTAKVVNFRYIYGGTKWGFHLDVNMPPFGLARYQEILDGLDTKYYGLKNWQDRNIKSVYQGETIILPTGRRFAIYKQPDKKTGELEYKVNQIKNYPVQGFAGGDILPLMCALIRRGMRNRNMKSKMILTVHDSLVFDYVDEERDELARLCYKVGNNLSSYVSSYYGFKMNVKLEVEVEVGPNYGEIKELTLEEVNA